MIMGMIVLATCRNDLPHGDHDPKGEIIMLRASPAAHASRQEPSKIRDYPPRPLANLSDLELLFMIAMGPYDPDLESATAIMMYEHR